MRKLLIAVVCHFQFCSHIGDDWFACGSPKHGSKSQMLNEISKVLPPRYENHECVPDGAKTPAWLKPSGLYRLQTAK